MALNIKDPEAHLLAKALASETGETMTRAVTEALRERLARVRQQRRSATLNRDLLAIGRRCVQMLTRKPVDHAHLLYDEQGLPK